MFKKYGLQVKLPALIFLLFYLPLLGISIFVYEYSQFNNENHLVKMIGKKVDAKIKTNFNMSFALTYQNIVRFSELPELMDLNNAIESAKGNPKNDPNINLKMKSVLSALKYFRTYLGIINSFSYVDPKTKIKITVNKKGSLTDIQDFSELSKSDIKLFNTKIKTFKNEDLYYKGAFPVKANDTIKSSSTYMTGLFNKNIIKALLIFEFEGLNNLDTEFPIYSKPEQDSWFIWTKEMGKGIINSYSAFKKDKSIYDILPELPKIDTRLERQNLWDESGNLLVYRKITPLYKRKLKKWGINLVSDSELELLYFYPNSMLSQEINEFRNVILTIIFGQLLLFTPILIFFVFKSKEIFLDFSKKLNKTNNKIAGSSGIINNFTGILASAQKQNLSRISRSVESVNLVGENFISFKKSISNGQRLNNENISLLETTTNTFKELENALDDLTKSSVQIESINTIMNDMAFKTNLLALNASVEAARAGEEGKGFAVVAKAIRELAENSSSSTKKISKIVIENTKRSKEGREKARKGHELLTTFYQNFNEGKEWILKTFDQLGVNVDNIENLKSELYDMKISMDKTNKEAIGLEELVPKLQEESKSLNQVTNNMNKIMEGK